MRIAMAEDDELNKKPIKYKFDALRGKEKEKIEKALSAPIPKSPPPNKPLPTPPNKPLPAPPNKPLPTPPVQEQVDGPKKKKMTIKKSIEKIFDDTKKGIPAEHIKAKNKISENLKIGAKALGQEMVRKLAETAAKTGDRVVNAAHKIVDKKNKGGRGV